MHKGKVKRCKVCGNIMGEGHSGECPFCGAHESMMELITKDTYKELSYTADHIICAMDIPGTKKIVSRISNDDPYFQNIKKLSTSTIYCVLHFSKRCLEVIFLHKYSGKLSLLTSSMITLAYSSIVTTIHEAVNVVTTPAMLEIEYQYTTYIGFTLFLLGEISNLYHHVLLSQLRKTSIDYKIPSGGLFPVVNCPHYLSEILAWLGIALMSKYQLVYGLSFVMSAYLVARSINTTKWYQERIPNFPKERKSLVPYIF